MNQNLRVNKTNFHMRTRFETEAKGNSEIAYLINHVPGCKESNVVAETATLILVWF